MKTTLLLVFLTTPYLILLSQHKTSYSADNDPLTEIIDPIGMKQGKWIFYNFHDEIIREETFLDNQLTSRESLVDNNTITTTNYRDIPLYDSLVNEIRLIDSNCKGEFLVNDLGTILAIHFYTQVTPTDQDLVRTKILTSYESTFTNVIITF